jgi:hypothetical protein
MCILECVLAICMLLIILLGVAIALWWPAHACSCAVFGSNSIDIALTNVGTKLSIMFEVRVL